MEQRIRPNTTITIVPNPKPGFAKRSGIVGVRPSLPPPRVVVGGPPRPLYAAPSQPRQIFTSIPQAQYPRLIASPKVQVTTELESMYLVSINEAEKKVSVTLPPGKEPFHTPAMSSAILNILTERQIHRDGYKTFIVKSSRALYDKSCIGGSPFSYINPASQKKTVFVVKRFGAGKVVASTPTPVISRPRGRPKKQETNAASTQDKFEVIDLDSDDEEDFSPAKAKRPNIQPKKSAASIAQIAHSQLKNRNAANDSAKSSNSAHVVPKPFKTPQSKFVPVPVPPPVVIRTVQRFKPEEEHHVSVVKGICCALPSKIIVPSSKSLSCLYRVPDLKKITESNAKSKLSFSVHPFLGERFMVVNGITPPKKLQLKSKDENKHPTAKDKKVVPSPAIITKRKPLQEQIASDSAKKKAEVLKENESLARSLRNRKLLVTAQTPTSTPTRSSSASFASAAKKSLGSQLSSTRKTHEIYLSSSSDDDSDSSSEASDSSSDSSEDSSLTGGKASTDEQEDDSNLRRSRRAVSAVSNKNKKTAKNNVKHEVLKPAPKYFAEAKPCRPIRKSPDGRIYFSLKAKVSPSEFHKNDDLFINWEKYVRNESDVGHYYKTMLMKTAHYTFFIYHMERQDEKLVVERSVEMLYDGTIKIVLKGEDVTHDFMQYVSIETNTELSVLLKNLINSHLCIGCPDFSLISVYPEAILRDQVWFSSKCRRVVFNEPAKFTLTGTASSNPYYSYILTEQSCPACVELRKRLEAETAEIRKFNLKNKFKIKEPENKNKRTRKAKQTLVFGKYKPPPVEKMQVRKAVSDLFLDFFKQLGFKEEEFPKQTVDLNVSVVSESDFPIIKEVDELIDPNAIPGLPPALPESIPILENIDFDENGQCNLTFSEIPLNPYEMQNIHFMNTNMNMPDFSNEMIDSLMNSSDPEAILQSLAGVPTTLLTDTHPPQVSQPPAGIQNTNPIENHNTFMKENNSLGNLISSGSTLLEGNSHFANSTVHESIPQSQHQQQQQYQHSSYEYHQQQYSQQEQQYYSQHQNHQVSPHPQMQNFNNPNLNASIHTANNPYSQQNLQYQQYPFQQQSHPGSDMSANLDMILNDGDSSLIFPTFSLTEL